MDYWRSSMVHLASQSYFDSPWMMELENPVAKLYLVHVQSKAIGERVQSEQFRRDWNELMKIKLWKWYESCWKSSKHNMFASDFSASWMLQNRGKSNITESEVLYDLHTFGLSALNLLTGHWLQIELTRVIHGNWTWPTHVWPIYRKTLQKFNNEYFKEKTFTLADISVRDVQQAIHFVRSILKIQP